MAGGKDKISSSGLKPVFSGALMSDLKVRPRCQDQRSLRTGTVELGLRTGERPAHRSAVEVRIWRW
jgi:hypothetical protein